MQYSHFRPDESIGSHGLRAASTIGGDHMFAKAAVDEKSALLTKAGLQDRGQSARQRIRHAFKGSGRMGAAWVIETIMLIFTILFVAYEFWTSCTRDVGLPHCYGCYTSAFLTWCEIWVCLWVTHLYTFLLLVSRDFEMYIGGGILSELMTNVLDRAIPRQGVVFYVAESALLIIWWIIGMFMLISSNSCLRGGRIYGDVGRSGLLFWWILWSILIWIPLMIFGRFVMAPAKYIYTKQVEEKPKLQVPKPSVRAPEPVVYEPVYYAEPAPVVQQVVVLPAPSIPVLQPVQLVAQPAPAIMRSMPALPARPSSPRLAYGSAPPMTVGVATASFGAVPVTGSLSLPRPVGMPVAGGSVVLSTPPVQAGGSVIIM